MYLLKNGVGGGGGGKVDRQKGLTRTRTDLTLVAQFRKNATRFRSRCNYVSDFDFLQKTKILVVGGNISTLVYRSFQFRVYRRRCVALGNCAISWRHDLPSR